MIAITFSWLDWTWDKWFNNDVLLYGVGPVLCYQVSFILSAIVLEILLKQKWVESSLITYAGNGTRSQALAKTHKDAGDLKYQLFGAPHSVVYTVFGKGTIIGGCLAYFVN